MTKRKIIVVTGERGSGKTSYCEREAETAREQGKQVAGVLSPAIYEDGKKTGFFARNLQNEEQRLAGTRQLELLNGKSVHHWCVDPETVEWVNEFLSEIHSCDLLIIDELGPFEFQHQQGYLEAFGCLRNCQYERALVVIRPECLNDFEAAGFEFDMIKVA